MKTLALSLACVGLTMIVLNELLHAQSREPEIIYKYVPRDLDAYLKDPENQPMAMYKSMFDDPPLRTY
jgi:hypothetical protein